MKGIEKSESKSFLHLVVYLQTSCTAECEPQGCPLWDHHSKKLFIFTFKDTEIHCYF